MAGKSQTLGKRRAMEPEADEEEREEREIEQLEAELRDMSRKISDYRETLPDQLVSALQSSLAAQRPILLPQIEGFASIEINASEESISENDKRRKEKLRIFMDKSERNIAITPNVLKRMDECLVRLNKVEKTGNVNVNPIFRKEI